MIALAKITIGIAAMNSVIVRAASTCGSVLKDF